MAIKCFAVVRAISERAHHLLGHTGHRLVGAHIRRTFHAAVRSLAPAYTTNVPTIVCVATGLAALGVGGFVARGTIFGSTAQSKISATTSVPTPIGASGFNGLPSGPRELESLPDTLFRFDWNEISGPNAPFTLPDTWLSSVWGEIGSLPDRFGPPGSFVSGGSPDTPRQAAVVAVPEPGGLSIFSAYLFGIGVLRWRLLNSAQAIWTRGARARGEKPRA